MADPIRLLAGPRFCPWCSPGRYSFGDWLADHLPYPVVLLLMPSWRLTGAIGMPLHERLHERRAKEKDGG